jgi:hypothetical protein
MTATQFFYEIQLLLLLLLLLLQLETDQFKGNKARGATDSRARRQRALATAARCFASFANPAAASYAKRQGHPTGGEIHVRK